MFYKPTVAAMQQAGYNVVREIWGHNEVKSFYDACGTGAQSFVNIKGVDFVIEFVEDCIVVFWCRFAEDENGNEDPTLGEDALFVSVFSIV